MYFCDVPKVGPGKNATLFDLLSQVHSALSLHPEVKEAKRINLHYARMGEPTYNMDVIKSTYILKETFDRKGWGFHPVVSTMMPKGHESEVFSFLVQWLRIKRDFEGNAGLQISINTTDQEIREKTMPMAMCLEDISDMMPGSNEAVGRKIALNFALTDAPIDAKYLKKLFDPRKFMCKITPMHNTHAVIKNAMMTNDGYDFYYPYKKAEEELKAVGFDVIVFIPSKEEDESRITCGNAILADRMINEP
jgi:23S rRNA (adenine2503-C2)-methyltransferase